VEDLLLPARREDPWGDREVRSPLPGFREILGLQTQGLRQTAPPRPGLPTSAPAELTDYTDSRYRPAGGILAHGHRCVTADAGGAHGGTGILSVRPTTVSIVESGGTAVRRRPCREVSGLVPQGRFGRGSARESRGFASRQMRPGGPEGLGRGRQPTEDAPEDGAPAGRKRSGTPRVPCAPPGLRVGGGRVPAARAAGQILSALWASLRADAAGEIPSARWACLGAGPRPSGETAPECCRHQDQPRFVDSWRSGSGRRAAHGRPARDRRRGGPPVAGAPPRRGRGGSLRAREAILATHNTVLRRELLRGSQRPETRE